MRWSDHVGQMTAGGAMPITGDDEPSASRCVADQVAEYETSGGTRANTLRDSGIPIVIVTMRGARSGKVRKIGLMRVERDGEYALVASKGGAPEHPAWSTRRDRPAPSRTSGSS